MILRILFTFCSLFLFSGCGYRLATQNNRARPIAISIGKVKGDVDGLLIDQLIHHIAYAGKLCYVYTGADYELNVTIKDNINEHIGFAYDMSANSEQTFKRLVPDQGERILVAEVVLVDQKTKKPKYGPQEVRCSVPYDFVNFDNIASLEFVDTSGVTQTVLDYSLGQLGAEEDARATSLRVGFRVLARRIVQSMAQLKK